jgi:hypothetical protein
MTSILAAVATQAGAVNLVSNGDFETGATGFMSDFTDTSVNVGAKEFSVRTDPKTWNGAFASFGDHTSGAGNMMVVNGSTSNTDVVWSQTVTVTPFEDFKLSFWIASVFASNPGEIGIEINDVSLGSAPAPNATAQWVMGMASWSSNAATSAKIELIDLGTAAFGNDYALDDISFTQTSSAVVPLPAALPLLASGLAGLAVAARRRRG